jgi:hypothetical protein
VIYMPELKLMRMWYRGAGWGTPSGLGIADSTDSGKTWKKYTGNPVWGGGRPNKLEAAGQPWIYREAADKYWVRGSWPSLSKLASPTPCVAHPLSNRPTTAVHDIEWQTSSSPHRNLYRWPLLDQLQRGSLH